MKEEVPSASHCREGLRRGDKEADFIAASSTLENCSGEEAHGVFWRTDVLPPFRELVFLIPVSEREPRTVWVVQDNSESSRKGMAISPPPRKRTAIIMNKAEGRHEKNSFSSLLSSPHYFNPERRGQCGRKQYPSLRSDPHSKSLEPLINLNGRKTLIHVWDWNFKVGKTKFQALLILN